MEHFTHGQPPSGRIDDGIGWRDTAHYVEAKVLADASWLPIYVLAVGDGVSAAVSCWDRQFDPIVDTLSRTDLDPGQFEAIFRRLQPTWWGCVDNAKREQYGDGALVEMFDPDTMNRKWMVAVLFSSTSGQQVAGSAMDRVLKLSVRIAMESANQPSRLDYARVAASGAIRGARRGSEVAATIVKAAQWLG